MVKNRFYPVGTGYTKELVIESAKDAIGILTKLSEEHHLQWKFASTAPLEINSDDGEKAKEKLDKVEDAIDEIKRIWFEADQMDEKSLAIAFNRIATLRSAILYG